MYQSQQKFTPKQSVHTVDARKHPKNSASQRQNPISDTKKTYDAKKSVENSASRYGIGWDAMA